MGGFKSNLKLRVHKILLNKFDKVEIRYGIDFIGFTIGFIFSTLFALFISIVINDNLSKSELGKFSYTKTALEICAYLLTFIAYRSYLRFNINGVSVVLKNFVSKIRIAALVALGIITYIMTNEPLSVVFILFIIHEEQIYLHRSLMKISALNKIRVGSALITLLAIYIINSFFKLTAEFALFSYGFGYSISLYYLFSRYPLNDDRNSLEIKTILLFSLPALGSLLVKLSLDFTGQFLLKEFFNFEEVSKFAIALRVLLSVKLFSNLLMMFYPTLYFKEIERFNINFIYRLRHFMVALMFFVSLIAFIFSESIYILMGASAYLNDIIIFRIMIIAELIFVIGNIWSTYLSYAIKTYVSLAIYFSGGFFNFLVLYCYLDKYGIIIVPISYLFSNIIIVIFQYFTGYKWEKKYINQNI